MISRFCFSVFAASFLYLTLMVSAADRRVPEEYATIQAAINASANGDRIFVAVGTYYENVDINKSITLASADPSDPSIVANTIIDAGGSGSAIKFSETVATDCELRGFTITGGYRGGVDCQAGNITIRNCIFSDNLNYSGSGKGGGISSDSDSRLTVIDSIFIRNTASGYGGGIFSDQGPLVVIGCEFIQNSAQHEGGGIATDYDEVTVQDCLFVENEADYGGAVHSSHYGAMITNCTFVLNRARTGGAICEKELYLGDETMRIRNCTLYGNIADEYGGAVSMRLSGNLLMSNCILWDNIAFLEGPQIATGHSGDISVSYCCVQGGNGDVYVPTATLNWLEGNIDVDPVFADAAVNDFHLQSMAGRWDANQKIWVIDSSHSPCIDTGDPGADWTVEMWPNGQRINMGAFGGTAEASKSQTTGENTILTISSTAGGSVNIPGEGSFEYGQGSLVSIEATAEADYRFVRWSGTAVDAGKVADPVLASTSVTMDGNYGLQANFLPMVPDVVGMTQANAESAIASIGNFTSSVSSAYSDSVPAGKVIGQDPVGGTTAPWCSVVGIVVSLGNIADIDSSGAVDAGDLKLLMEKWLIVGISLREDLNGDGIINLRDFAVLANYWGWSE